LNKDIADLKEKFNDVTRIQQELKKQVFEIPETKIETAIPIKRERALAPLTETELHVLEIIAEGGEKTAPEIKDLIKLTREHSARLVKKLYEEGYLERSTEKTPYAYRVKEEMLKILKKTSMETKA
jgi:predicted HTH transcriptional regulator